METVPRLYRAKQAEKSDAKPAILRRMRHYGQFSVEIKLPHGKPGKTGLIPSYNKIMPSICHRTESGPIISSAEIIKDATRAIL
jgi:hypothetical protein